MRPQDIIEALAFEPGKVPRKAIESASARREEMIPAFIAEIERFLATDCPSEEEIDRSPLLAIVHLLGEWRAKAAYRCFCRLLRIDDVVLDRIFGDAQEYHSAIAEVLFDGDTAPIEEVILDPSADQFARDAMFDALVNLALTGATDRAAVEAFVRSAHSRLEPRKDSMVWDGWQNAVAVLGLTDLAELARQAITTEQVPYFVTTTVAFDKDLEYALAHPDHPWGPVRQPRILIPTLELLQRFADVAEANAAREERRYSESAVFPEEGFPGGEPAFNPWRDVGRNDPCPCGSGRKFKKCCLGKIA